MHAPPLDHLSPGNRSEYCNPPFVGNHRRLRALRHSSRQLQPRGRAANICTLTVSPRCSQHSARAHFSRRATSIRRPPSLGPRAILHDPVTSWTLRPPSLACTPAPSPRPHRYPYGTWPGVRRLVHVLIFTVSHYLYPSLRKVRPCHGTAHNFGPDKYNFHTQTHNENNI